MKRIFIALLGGLLFSTLAVAQITYFNQHGRASQELNAEGFAIAHPILPLNARVMMSNTLTGETIEVTVVGRVPPSLARIADLSPAAWEALGLNQDSEIRIFTNAAGLPDLEVLAPPLAEAEEEGYAQIPPVAQAEQVYEEAARAVNQGLAANDAVAAVPAELLPAGEMAAPQVIAAEPFPQAPPARTEADLLEHLITLMARQETPAAPSVVVNVNPNLAQNVKVQGTAQGGAPAIYHHAHPPAEPPAAPGVTAPLPLKPAPEEPKAYAAPQPAPSIDPDILTRLLAVEAAMQEEPTPAAPYTPPDVPGIDPAILARLLAVEAAMQEEPVAVTPVAPYTAPAVPGIDPAILARLLAVEAAMQEEPIAVTPVAPYTAPAVPGIDPAILARLLAVEAAMQEEPIAVTPVAPYIPQAAPDILARLLAMEAAMQEELMAAPPAPVTPYIPQAAAVAPENIELIQEAQNVAAPPAPHITLPPAPVPFGITGPISPEIMAMLYDPEIMAMLMALEPYAVTPPAHQPDPPVIVTPPVIPYVPPVPPAPANQPQPAVANNQPRVFPALPDPDSGRLYRLQIGAFSTMDAANRMSQLLASVGFSVVQEHNGSIYRVLAVDVPSAMVYPAVQRLGVVGISQVWVRE